MKMFRSAKPDDDLYPIDPVNELLEEMWIDGLKRTGEPPMHANYTEGYEDNSAALQVRLD